MSDMRDRLRSDHRVICVDLPGTSFDLWNRTDIRQLVADGRTIDQLAELSRSGSDARRVGVELGRVSSEPSEVISQGFLAVSNLRSIVHKLGKLLRAEGDQNADDDDSDFADQGSPAVQRFWQMEVHADVPDAACYGHSTLLANGSFGSKAATRKVRAPGALQVDGLCSISSNA